MLGLFANFGRGCVSGRGHLVPRTLDHPAGYLQATQVAVVGPPGGKRGSRKMFVDPIIEGPVEIAFADSKGKQKVTFTIDFGKTDLSSREAAGIFKAIVSILRSKLGIKLSKCA